MSVILLGDSLTEYGDWETLLGEFVKNHGLAGDTTQGLLGRLLMTEFTNPTKFFLMIGLNDLLWHLNPSEVIRNIQNIVFYLNECYPQTAVYVQSILPIYSETKINENIRFVNEELANFCEVNAITWINLYEQFADTLGSIKLSLTTDGVHLSQEGYDLWATLLKPHC